MPLSDAAVRRLVRATAQDRPDHAIAAIAARQDGVISVRQERLAGLSGSAADRRVAAGRLHPLLRGVHAVGHPAVGRRGWWQAALLAGGPEAALSHRAVAEACGVISLGDGPIDITVPGVKRHHLGRVRFHSGRLERRDVVVRDGLPMTTVARMVLDLAEQISLRELVEVMDQCEARRLYRPLAVADVIRRSPGRRGLRTLRRAQRITRPQDVLTRSRLERRALRLVAAHNLPRPEVNVMLHGYEVDLLWRDADLAVELDSRTHHGDAVALDRDHRRDANLQAHGYRVLRFTWRQVIGDAPWVASRIRQLLG